MPRSTTKISQLQVSSSFFFFLLQMFIYMVAFSFFVIAKLFLNTKTHSCYIRSAATTLLALLEVDHVDSFVISVSGTLEAETSREDLSPEFIQAFLPLWKVCFSFFKTNLVCRFTTSSTPSFLGIFCVLQEMETLVRDKLVRVVGVSDFSRIHLEQIWPLVEVFILPLSPLSFFFFFFFSFRRVSIEGCEGF
jgi:diketogulonate reductase-like aldo/keto reductase